MELKDILNFKNSIKDLSIEELTTQKLNLQEEISKMVLNCDCITKIAIIEALIDEKKETK